MKDYLIALSSFYKAAFGQETLAESGIRAVLKRTPPNLVGSCGYSLAVKTDKIQNVLEKLSRRGVSPVRTFLVEEENGKIKYIPFA